MEPFKENRVPFQVSRRKTCSQTQPLQHRTAKRVWQAALKMAPDDPCPWHPRRSGGSWLGGCASSEEDAVEVMDVPSEVGV